MLNKLIVILGPTATGKTNLAVKLAKQFNCEIISADSRQIYQGMDIGTGKDLKEYGKTPYHLIDIAKPQKRITLAGYQKKAYQAINNILKRGKLPLLVGGTGLYIQAIVDGYQLTEVKPDLKLRKKLDKKTLKQLQNLAKKYKINLNQSDFNNKRRLIRSLEIQKSKGKSQNSSLKIKKPLYQTLLLGLKLPKEELNKKIDQRLKQRLEKEGLIDEVKKLKSQGLSYKKLDEFGLEYRFVAKYLQGQLTYAEMADKLAIAIRQFAKRQMTWFKRDQKIIWLKNKTEAKKLIDKFIK